MSLTTSKTTRTTQGRGRGKRPSRESEEREERLTDSLFGGGSRLSKRAKQRTQHERSDVDDDDVEGRGESYGVEDVEREEQYMDDDQLFMIDTRTQENGESGVESDEEMGKASSGTSEDSTDDESTDDEEQTTNDGPEKHAPTRRRKPVWTDPSTASRTIVLSGPEAKADDGSRRGTNRLRKLRETVDEQTVTGIEYEMRLRKMFEKLHPRPSWASLSLRNQIAASSAIGELLNSDVGLVNRVTGDARRKRQALPSSRLEIQRMRNANESQGRTGDLSPIEQVAFHPSTRATLLLTTAKDRRARLFHVDGKENPMLDAIHIPELPMRNARIHPTGSSILLTGPRPFFYVHDLYAGKTIKSTPWRAEDEGSQERDLTLARFSYDKGRRLAVGGRRGAVYLYDWGNANGAADPGTSGGSLMGTVRMNAPLAGLTWDAIDDRRLVTLSTQGTMHSWDVRSMRCEVQRTDAGLFAPTGLATTMSGQWWAVGSDGGIVNMYGREAIEGGERVPLEPRKSLSNLVTTTTSLTFNPTGEVLAIASSRKKDALKLAHLPSLSVFENWPTSDTPLGVVSAVDFSPSSRYLAIGNHRGKVLLYTLHHFS